MSYLNAAPSDANRTLLRHCLRFLLALMPLALSLTDSFAGPPTPVAITITRIKCADGCDEEGLEALLEDKPDFYARVYINGADTDTPRDNDVDDISPFWTVGGSIPDTQATFPVTIQIWDYDSTSGDDLGDATPVGGKNNLDLVVDRLTGKWSGDINWPQSCAQGGGGDEPTVMVCFAISVDSNTGDADGDGLLDGWERNGLDSDGDGTIDVNLPAMGAKALRKDLFLELDSEAGQTPTRAAIQAMKSAFAAAPIGNPDGSTGISLWVDTGTVVDTSANEAGPVANCSDGIDNDGDGQVDGADTNCAPSATSNPYLDSATENPVSNCGDGIDNDGDGLVDGADPQCLVGDSLGGGGIIGTVGACNLDNAFYTAKKANFNPLRAWVFRYAISAQRPGSPTCSGSSGGQGEIGGNDFTEFNHDGGTVMHELGHNLNLRHGGNEDTNCKPNYVSVMNYDNQIGIQRIGGGAIIDYSPPRITLNGSARGNAPLPTLVENGLNENVVLDLSDNANRFIFSISAGNVVQRNLNQNPNWNNDPDPPLEPSVTANIDNGTQPGCANGSNNETLNGFNDWPAVSLPFRQFGDSSDSAINPGPEEPTLQQLRDHQKVSRTTDLAVEISDAPDPVAAGTNLTFNVKATNRGSNPASSVRLSVTLPSSTPIVGTPAGCTVAGQVVTCHLGELLASQSTSVTIVVSVPADLVYNNGAPLTVATVAQVANLTGFEAAIADNTWTEQTKVVAVADLSMVSFAIPNPPVQMKVGELVPIELHSVISSAGPSSPMDTHLTMTANASSGAWVNPTWLVTHQPRLTIGEMRGVDDHAILRCDSPGRHSIRFEHTIRPRLPDDSDPNAANDAKRIGFEIDCVGRREVKINIWPGRFPNAFSARDQETPVGVMTTRDGEYGLPAFDAVDVIPETLRFGPRPIVSGVAPGIAPWNGRGELRDVPEPLPPESVTDGDLDLFQWFDTSRSGLRPGDAEACVVGEYIERGSGSKQPFFGCDSIELR